MNPNPNDPINSKSNIFGFVLGITKCRKSKLDRGLNFVMDSNPKLQKA
jgi:hypothetical protein